MKLLIPMIANCVLGIANNTKMAMKHTIFRRLSIPISFDLENLYKQMNVTDIHDYMIFNCTYTFNSFDEKIFSSYDVFEQLSQFFINRIKILSSIIHNTPFTKFKKLVFDDKG